MCVLLLLLGRFLGLTESLHTVIRMTLVSFHANDTHLKKNFKSAHLGDYYSNVMVQSYSLEWSYRVDGIGDLDLRKKRRQCLDLRLGSSTPTT